jgi:tRNA-modifying protein YgfZ
MIIAAMIDPAPDTSVHSTSSAAFSGATRLSDWAVIRAQGADAASFLQGQLTNDIANLPSGRAALAGYCSAKGRLLASFIVWSPAADEFLLACSADLLPAALKRLSMFVLRAKCKLTDASGELSLWGMAGDAAGHAGQAWSVMLETGAQTVRLPDAAGTARALHCQAVDAAPPAGAALDSAAWRWLEVRSGVVRIVAATADQFVPQMVNFELVGGVDFKKGCYPGQEIVARSQYRGTVKRRAALLSLPAGAVPAMAEGQEVFHDADLGQPAGMVALAARHPQGDQLALAEVKLALAQSPGSFRLGAPDGEVLHAQPLPYPLPSDTD